MNATRMKTLSLVVALFVAIATWMTGCASGNSAGPQTGTVTVTIKDLRFDPAVVTIRPGAKIRWINRDTTAHTSTSADFSAEATSNPPGSWNSPVLDVGKSWTRTFDTAGTFDYACSIHPYIKGTVKVISP